MADEIKATEYRGAARQTPDLTTYQWVQLVNATEGNVQINGEVGFTLNPHELVAYDPVASGLRSKGAVRYGNDVTTAGADTLWAVAQETTGKEHLGFFALRGRTTVKCVNAAAIISPGQYVRWFAGGTFILDADGKRSGTTRMTHVELITGTYGVDARPSGAIGVTLAGAVVDSGGTDGTVDIFLFGEPSDVPPKFWQPGGFLSRWLFYEDFLAQGVSAASPNAGVLVPFDHPWWRVGGGFAVQTVGGQMQVVSDGTNIGAGHLSNQAGGTLATRWNANRRPIIAVRWSQQAAGAGTRRVGLANTTFGAAAEPTDGIYFRHTAAGNIIAVVRAAASELTLDTLVAAADGVFHEGVLEVTAGDPVNVYLDGVLIGSIPSVGALPTVDLAPAAGVSVVTNVVGLNIDYFAIEQNRA